MLEFFEGPLEGYEKNIAVLTLKVDGTIIEANQCYLEMLNINEDNINNQDIDHQDINSQNINSQNIDSENIDSENIVGQNIVEFDSFLAGNNLATLQNASYGHYHSHLVKIDKELIPIEVVFFRSMDKKERITLFIKNLHFLNEVKWKVSFLSKIFQASTEGILITDASGYILCVNESFRKITGYSNQEVLGHTPAILQSGEQDKHFYRKFWQQLTHKGSWQGEICNKRKNGEKFIEWLNVSSLKGENGEITHYICQFSDITLFKKTIEDKKLYTYYDALTCLPNRALLFEKLAILRKASKTQSSSFSVLLCDLDRFKLINETYGHHVGDELLKCIADRLAASLRSHDILARSGDDEFVIIVEGDKSLKNIDKVCQHILSIFEQPFSTIYGDFKMSMSIGISQFPLDSVNVRELLSFADVAMQKVKRSSGNNYAIFDPSGKEMVRRQHSLDQDIKLALDKNEFEVWYQPQINSITREVFGVECLLRWNHATQGIISPFVFIPILESNGMIKEVGDFVLREACQQIKTWEKKNLFKGIVAINVSLRQLESLNFSGKVEEILAEYKVDPQRIELEVTESLFSDDNNNLIPTLLKLQKLGVKLSLDDFGTGYSSLQRLKVLPVDNVKIDKCFIDNITTSEKDASIIKALIMISKTFGFGLIAEGIETKKQANCLNTLGCIKHQGYLYNKPLRVKDFDRWFEQFNDQYL